MVIPNPLRSASGALQHALRAAAILAATALLGLAAPAAAQSPDPADALVLAAGGDAFPAGSRAWYLEDSDGTLTLADVLRETNRTRFAPVGAATPNFGFTNSAYWLRLVLRPQAGAASRWFLDVGYPPLDRVEVHDPVRGAGGVVRYRARESGDRIPFADRPMAATDHVFPLDLEPGKSHEVYVRVSNAGSLTVPLRVLSEAGLDRHRARDGFVLALFFGAALALALYNLLLWTSLRDRTYLLYVGFVAAAGMAYFCYNGLAHQFLWPDATSWNNVAPMFFAYLTVALAALFSHRFLRLDRYAARLDRVGPAIALLCTGGALASLWEPAYPLAARAYSVITLLLTAWACVAGWISLRGGYRPARWYVAAWAVMLAGVAAFSLRGLNVVPGSFFSLYGMQIGAAIEMLLLSFAMADRIQLAQAEADRMQAAALATLKDTVEVRERALEASRRAEQDMETLVAERVQELASVNRKLEEEIFERRRAEELLRRMAHHDSLTGLPNRALLKDRFGMAASAAKRNGTHLALLVIDLDEFKAINEEHGHDTGDDLLVGIARLLQTRMREMDTIARLGGDEFAVLVSDLSSPREAARVAEKVLAILSQPVRVSANRSVNVSASIGIAVHGVDGTSVEALLKRAEASMYTAKEAGRASYRFSTIPQGA